jgi:HK97 family phage portal protein
MYPYPALHHHSAPRRSFFARLIAAWSAKASVVGPLIARLVVGQAVWPERDYAKLAKEGYQQNPVVNACVKIIAESVAQIPWCLYSGKGEDKTEIDDHPFLDLMQSPNPEQDWQSLITALVSHYKITGNLYCERTNEDMLERMELYAHRPDRITVVPDETGVPAAYKYRCGGAERDFQMDPAKQVRPLLHLKTFNPLNDWYGQSPLDACAWAIDLHNNYSSHTLGMLQNSGSPSGALVFEGSEAGGMTLDPDNFERLLARIRGEERGYDRTGSRMVLDGGKYSWLQMGLDQEKMQALDGKNQAAREIAFTLGVPPMLLGIPGDNTYSNYQEARQAFYQETVIPLARMLVRAFQHWFAKSLGKGVTIEANIDELDALAEVRAQQWDRIEKSTTLSLNEKRDALGYEPVDGGDEHYTSAGQIPLSMATDVAEADQARQDAALKQKKPPAKSLGGPSFRSPPVVHEASK